MRDDIRRNLSQSSYDFVNLVWPIIANPLGGGELVPVESVTTDGFKKDLDTLAGIDAWQVIREHSAIRGIASRIQPVTTPYNTFTIRYRCRSGAETEYAKRLRAIEKAERGWLFPHLTVHAYINIARDRVLSVGVVSTRQLFLYAQQWLESERAYIKVNTMDGNLFIVVPWQALQRDKIMIQCFCPIYDS